MTVCRTSHGVQVGPGCVAWFIIAEIFPTYARDAAMALGVSLNWVAYWLVVFTFPIFQHALGPYTFLLFFAATSVFGVFTYYCVPETKGRTIAHLFREFDGRPAQARLERETCQQDTAGRR